MGVDYLKNDYVFIRIFNSYLVCFTVVKIIFS